MWEECSDDGCGAGGVASRDGVGQCCLHCGEDGWTLGVCSMTRSLRWLHRYRPQSATSFFQAATILVPARGRQDAGVAGEVGVGDDGGGWFVAGSCPGGGFDGVSGGSGYGGKQLLEVVDTLDGCVMEELDGDLGAGNGVSVSVMWSKVDDAKKFAQLRQL